MPLPVLFVSHGSPMLALDASQVGQAWRAAVAPLTGLKGIVVISAHWQARHISLTDGGELPTIHDFYGFPPALYQQTYAAHGSQALSEQVAAQLRTLGEPVVIDPQRGLDHGAWVPLREMFPAGDIPIVQVALQAKAAGEHHYQLGEALRPLRDQDILIVASGSLTHNLYEIDPHANAAEPYVTAFQQWVWENLQHGRHAELCDMSKYAPAAQRAHPTDEHWLPLVVAAGAAGPDAKACRPYTGVEAGVLAMDMFRFD
ncbi:class III extradiol ring-cleavage dioxygenase [Chitinivorax sp. B]|uniref:dioxygenase family protein n=1 Tax=Chitinivorax sp. B TaxID=2502235 RepID=UPI0010F53A28|nr:class III extradiol ring-cleavage dioxygenase [Chitinivorax sp. B]